MDLPSKSSSVARLARVKLSRPVRATIVRGPRSPVRWTKMFCQRSGARFLQKITVRDGLVIRGVDVELHLDSTDLASV